MYLKPDQQVARRLHAVTVGDAAHQLRGDQCLDDVAPRIERAGLLPGGEQVIGQ